MKAWVAELFGIAMVMVVGAALLWVFKDNLLNYAHTITDNMGNILDSMQVTNPSGK